MIFLISIGRAVKVNKKKIKFKLRHIKLNVITTDVLKTAQRAQLPKVIMLLIYEHLLGYT